MAEKVTNGGLFSVAHSDGMHDGVMHPLMTACLWADSRCRTQELGPVNRGQVYGQVPTGLIMVNPWTWAAQKWKQFGIVLQGIWALGEADPLL